MISWMKFNNDNEKFYYFIQRFALSRRLRITPLNSLAGKDLMMGPIWGWVRNQKQAPGQLSREEVE